jgi:UDP-N-acetylmuramate-alanine ligase
LAEPGDMVLTLGAGSVSQLGPMVLEQLKKKQAAMSSQQSA